MESAKNLIDELPTDFLINNWKGFIDGSEDFQEKALVLELLNADFRRTIVIDIHKKNIDKLPESIRQFAIKIENAVGKLAE